ncbi:MAG: HEAT repeat domain-containing protein, partial [Candidatus Latescibacteria bacterium]|nr:HEAT repeat domain-containing protein [Candidatus Latescibacterota bacterium]
MRLRIPLSGLGASERTRFLYSALGFMCVASGALIARTAGDALFLSRYEASLLSYMYVGTAILVAGISYVYGILAGRVAIGRLIVRTGGVLVVLIVGLRIALAFPWGGFRVAAYLLSDLVVNVPMMLFWSFAALVFDPREGKRLFGFVGAAGTVACILAGYVVRPIAAAFGIDNLLVLVALCTVGFLLVVARLSALESGRFQPVPSGSGRRPSHIGYYAQLLQTPQVRNLIFLVLTATVTLTLVDYQFKAGARLHHSGADLAGFFGSFYASASVVALLIQLVFVHRILQRGGVLLGLLILPAGLVLTASGTAITAQFSWIVATKFVVQVCAFTIDSAALQMLYLGIAKQSRSQSRAFVEGIGKPFAMAATGAGLVAGVRIFELHHLAIAVAAGSLAWLFLTRRNSGSYLAALIDSLGARRLDLSEETSGFFDKSFESHLRQSLTSAADEEIPYLIDLLPEMESADWTPEFRSLLQREDAEVKIACLEHLQSRGSETDLAAVLSHLKHPSSEVRAAAVHASASLGGQAVLPDLVACLEDPDPEVRAAAVSALINGGDLDHLLAAGSELKEMLGSDDPLVRIAAANALSHIRHKGLTRPLMGLLEDLDDRVRVAALEACRSAPDEDLIPATIPLLADSIVAAEAAETLAEYGPEVLDHLGPYMDLSQMEGAFAGAHRVPPIVAEIGDPDGLPLLLSAIGIPDLRLRHEAVRAYCSLIGSTGSLKTHLADLRQVAAREIDAARTRRRILGEVRSFPATEILCDALQGESGSHLENAFTLLDVLTPAVDMKAVHLSLNSEESRSNALEILDNVLEGDLKTNLLGLLESREEAAPATEDIAARISGILRDET